MRGQDCPLAALQAIANAEKTATCTTLSPQKSRVPPARDSLNLSRASSPSQPSRIECRRKRTPPTIWRSERRGGEGPRRRQAERRGHERHRVGGDARPGDAPGHGERDLPADVLREDPVFLLDEALQEKSLRGGKLRAARHLEGRSDVRERRSRQAAPRPIRRSRRRGLDWRESARASAAVSFVSTTAPAPRRWRRPGWTLASRRLASHCGLAATRSGSSTIRPGGSADSGASRGKRRAPVPSRSGPSRASSTYTRSNPARRAASAARRTRGRPRRTVSGVGEPADHVVGGRQDQRRGRLLERRHTATCASRRSRAARCAAMWSAASSRKSAKLGQAFRSITKISPSGVMMASPPQTASSSARAARAAMPPSAPASKAWPGGRMLPGVEPLEPGGRASLHPGRSRVGVRDAVELHEVAVHVLLDDGARQSAAHEPIERVPNGGGIGREDHVALARLVLGRLLDPARREEPVVFLPAGKRTAAVVEPALGHRDAPARRAGRSSSRGAC